MNSTLCVIKRLKRAILALNLQVKFGIRNARKYILKLIDIEEKLAAFSKMQPEKQIIQLIESSDLIATLDNAANQVKIYVSDLFGEKLGYVDITNLKNPVFKINDGGIVVAIVKQVLRKIN